MQIEVRCPSTLHSTLDRGPLTPKPGRSLINKQTLELHYLVLQRGISARAWKAISNTLAFPPGMEAYK